MSFFNKLASGLKSAGKLIVKGVKKAVDYGAKAVGYIIESTTRIAGEAFNTFISGIKKIAAKISKEALEEVIDLYERLLAIGEGTVNLAHKVWDLLERIIKTIKREGVALGNAIRAFFQGKNPFLLVLKKIQSLLEECDRIIKEKSFESLEHFSRTQVSWKILQNLSSKIQKSDLESNPLTVDEIDLVELIEKYLSENLGFEDRVIFDTLVKKKFGKDLLVLGSEEIHKVWEVQLAEFRSARDSNRDRIIDLEFDLTEIMNEIEVEGENDNIIEARDNLKDKLESYKRQESFFNNQVYNLTIILGAARGLVQIYAEKENNPGALSLSEEVGDILIQWQNGNNPKVGELETLERFASMFIVMQ